MEGYEELLRACKLVVALADESGPTGLKNWRDGSLLIDPKAVEQVRNAVAAAEPREPTEEEREWAKENSDRYSARLEAIGNRVHAALDAAGAPESDRIVRYSAYDVDDNDLPLDNLDDNAVEGRCVFVAEHDEFWGEGTDYESNVVDSPSWLQVTVLANEAILTTGDHHHSFLEGLLTGLTRDDGTKIVRFAFGS